MAKSEKEYSACGSALLALIAIIVAMATNYWSVSNLLAFGLWKYCGRCSDCTCASIPSDGLTGAYQGVQAAVCLSFVANALALVTLGLLIFCSILPRKILKMVSVFLLQIAVLFTIIAVLVYFLDVKEPGLSISWSWGVAIGAGVLQEGAVGVAAKISTSEVEPAKQETPITVQVAE